MKQPCLNKGGRGGNICSGQKEKFLLLEEDNFPLLLPP